MFKRFLARRPSHPRGSPAVEIDSVIYAGGRYYTAMVLELVNKPGVAGRIIDEIARRGINIVKITTPYMVTGDRGHLLLVLENCDESCAEGLKREFEGMRDIVLRVEATSGMDVFLFPKLGGLKLLGDKSLVLTQGMAAEAIRQGVKALGRSGVAQALRSLGRGVGVFLYKNFYTMLATPPSPEAQLKASLEFLVDVFKALGLGDVEYELKGLEARFKVYGGFECEAARDAGVVGTAGDFTSGVLEGYLELAFGRRVGVKEEKCVARGDSHCEYKVSFYEPLSE